MLITFMITLALVVLLPFLVRTTLFLLFGDTVFSAIIFKQFGDAKHD